MIAADARVLAVRELSIESVLTGESLPDRKSRGSTARTYRWPNAPSAARLQW